MILELSRLLSFDAVGTVELLDWTEDCFESIFDDRFELQAIKKLCKITMVFTKWTYLI